jgi:hemolysin-activating ACP:hemolysin acyltransferase
MGKKSPVKAEGEKSTVAGAPVDPVAGKSMAEVFGEIVWLMSQDKDARDLPIRDLEWLVMPPILLKQFHITYAPAPSGHSVRGEAVRSAAEAGKQNLQPVSVELFAMCSDAVAAALDANPGIRLSFQDWRSGPNKRVLRTVGLKRAADRAKPTVQTAPGGTDE